jgi:hypothetical protein
MLKRSLLSNVKSFINFRVGNAVEAGNPNTLINFLKNSILSENRFTIHSNARRILIGIDDIALFADRYLENLSNTTVNLTYPYQYSLSEILSHLENMVKRQSMISY